MSNQVYTVCLVTKVSVAGKEQCVDFTTLDTVEKMGRTNPDDRQRDRMCIRGASYCGVALQDLYGLCCKGNSSRNNGPDDDLSKRRT